MLDDGRATKVDRIRLALSMSAPTLKGELAVFPATIELLSASEPAPL